jgi:hypothetical protein
MPADTSCLHDYVQKHFTDHEVTCCYEAGCCGYWIARTLQQTGWNVLVLTLQMYQEPINKTGRKQIRLIVEISVIICAKMICTAFIFQMKNRSN